MELCGLGLSTGPGYNPLASGVGPVANVADCIMSDAFELCVGHFHFMLDIFLFNIKTLDPVIKNSHLDPYPDFWPP